MFRDDFVWGVASSAYQVEGRDPADGAGKTVWDMFAEEGKVYAGQNAATSCDHMHRYREDYALMRSLGIRAHRFSVNWARLMPEGTGRVNERAVEMYRDMLLSMRENGIRPFLTLFHWEFPLALYERGGWMNPDVVEWFGEYARVVAESFGDLCEDFITINEPQSVISLGHLNDMHAPAARLSARESFRAAHNLLMAHGNAVAQLRGHAGRKIRVGYSPTCGVAYPATDSPADVAAAKAEYFGFNQPMGNWAWNVSWFSDPVFLGHYPGEGLEKFAPYLPDFGEGDMALISQPLDFMGENIYNGYAVRAGAGGAPEAVAREIGHPRTANNWPVTPEALYYGVRFLHERYGHPIYITENGMVGLDIPGPDGRVHDADRIAFLEGYLGALQRAADDGADVAGYFLWTFLDNFEWERGFQDRFGIIYVDFGTQRRVAKDSAYWYRRVIETNGAALAVNQPIRQPIFLDPVCTHNVWGGTRLREEYGCREEGDDVGECWGISAHPKGDGVVRFGDFAGMRLSEVWERHPEAFGSLPHEKFPLLTKIIDARDDLSIQVHPDDAYAARRENGETGKTECWYILDCEEGATLVIGHNAKTREELCDMVRGGRWGELIREVPVKKGDFVQIDPGTVHAIKGGITLLETQQNSDVTYRVYDYGRLYHGAPRELHVEKSLDVIKVPAAPPEECVLHPGAPEPNALSEIYSCGYYRIFQIRVRGRAAFAQKYPFLSMSVVEGDGIACGCPVKKGDHFILPRGLGEADLCGDMLIIASTVGES